MPKLSILVVEDDALSRKVMASRLSGHAVDYAEDAGTARRLLDEGRHDLCFIDLELGREDDCSGLDLIPLAAQKGVYPVVMSAHDSEPLVEKAYALGCRDFYAKGNAESNVRRVLDAFLSRREKSVNAGLFTERFVTQDEATRETINEALGYAPAELPILILGPSGTGKTSLARVIHERSRRPGAFVAINCAAYTEELLEAELFGYRKGAFTGANDNRKGKLLLADGGTLFLDEVGAMSLKMQTKLLKAVEERSFYPLGAERAETSRFRLISATLEDVQALIKAGRLRFDFYQRIHGLTVRLKPLAERKDDIFPLIEHFTRGGKRLSFAPDAKELLRRHDWPGNARELRRFVELLVDGARVEGRVTAAAAARLLDTAASATDEPVFVSDGQYDFAVRNGLNAAVERFVDAVIERNLAENGDKRTKVLASLRIPTSRLYATLKRLKRSQRP
jgi:DNA-binding NtrC family response regulator